MQEATVHTVHIVLDILTVNSKLIVLLYCNSTQQPTLHHRPANNMFIRCLVLKTVCFLFHHVNGFILYPFLSERVQMEPNGPVMVNLVPFARSKIFLFKWVEFPFNCVRCYYNREEEEGGIHQGFVIAGLPVMSFIRAWIII